MSLGVFGTSVFLTPITRIFFSAATDLYPYPTPQHQFYTRRHQRQHQLAAIIVVIHCGRSLCQHRSSIFSQTISMFLKSSSCPAQGQSVPGRCCQSQHKHLRKHAFSHELWACLEAVCSSHTSTSPFCDTEIIASILQHSGPCTILPCTLFIPYQSVYTSQHSTPSQAPHSQSATAPATSASQPASTSTPPSAI